jgi:hypothetical protein
MIEVYTYMSYGREHRYNEMYGGDVIEPEPCPKECEIDISVDHINCKKPCCRSPNKKAKCKPKCRRSCCNPCLQGDRPNCKPSCKKPCCKKIIIPCPKPKCPKTCCKPCCHPCEPCCRQYCRPCSDPRCPWHADECTYCQRPCYRPCDPNKPVCIKIRQPCKPLYDRFCKPTFKIGHKRDKRFYCNPYYEYQYCKDSNRKRK